MEPPPPPPPLSDSDEDVDPRIFNARNAVQNFERVAKANPWILAPTGGPAAATTIATAGASTAVPPITMGNMPDFGGA